VTEEIPSFLDELTAKTLKAIEDLLHKRQTEQITQDQLEIALDSLFTAVSGMVKEDTLAVFSAARGKTRTPTREIAIYQKVNVVVLTREIGKGQVRLLEIPVAGPPKDTVRSFQESTFPDQSAATAFAKVKESLESKGYRRSL
jgi:hypothetical protein